MPYIVTITTPNPGDCGDPDCESCNQDIEPVVVSRAVATLDEARATAWKMTWDALDASDDPVGTDAEIIARRGDAEIMLMLARTVEESGRTIGPLPDGTVIVVQRVGWDHFGRFAQGQARPLEYQQLLDAFNAR